MSKSKMIVVWGSEDILSSSMEIFLAGKDDWKMVKVSKKADLDALILVPETTQPIIVIVHEGCHDHPTHLTLQLLQEYPVIKVITVNLENNGLEVFSKQRILVKKVSDLISAIENKF